MAFARQLVDRLFDAKKYMGPLGQTNNEVKRDVKNERDEISEKDEIKNQMKIHLPTQQKVRRKTIDEKNFRNK